MIRTLVEIRCIATREAAAMAIDAGANRIGLVAPMPSGPGPIEVGRLDRARLRAFLRNVNRADVERATR